MKQTPRILKTIVLKTYPFIVFLLLWQAVVMIFRIKVFILPLADRHLLAPPRAGARGEIQMAPPYPGDLHRNRPELLRDRGVGHSHRDPHHLVEPAQDDHHAHHRVLQFPAEDSSSRPSSCSGSATGLLPNTLIAVLVAFFPVVINTATGLEAVDEDLLDLVRYLHASKLQLFIKIRIPNSLPYIFSGFKISATLCVVGSIVGEFIASDKGLGYLLKDAQAFIDTPTMFACLILISVIGVVFFSLISILERLVMPWKPAEQEEPR